MKSLVTYVCLLSALLLTGCGMGSQATSPVAKVQASENKENVGSNLSNQTISTTHLATVNETSKEIRLLGPQPPAQALQYMKDTPNLVLVEVNNPEWKLRTPLAGSLHIPYTQMAERYKEIPANRPVILYCGGGIVSVEAYATLKEKRPDSPELSYIAGAPPVSAYNEWFKQQNS